MPPLLQLDVDAEDADAEDAATTEPLLQETANLDVFNSLVPDVE